MAVVLVSFIGRGKERPGGEAAGYDKADYCFPDGAEPGPTISTSLFAAALLRYLTASGARVDRWLVFGTAESIWGELSEALPDEDRTPLTECWVEVDELVRAGRLTRECLAAWESAFRAVRSSPEPRFRLVGTAADAQAAEIMWGELQSAIGTRDRVILDVTHGFRHLPLLAASMLTVLRWERGLRSVELWYGGLELGRTPGRNSFPVQRLTLFDRLLRTAEQVATHQLTGSFRELGESAGLGGDDLGALRKIAFQDEINHPDPAGARQLLARLDGSEGFGDPFQQLPLSRLRGELSALAGGDLGARLLKRANFAHGKGQHFKAVALLYEAIRVSACDWYGLVPNTNHDTRENAMKRLFKDPAVTGDRTTLNLLWRFRHLRNGILHGSSPDVDQSEVREALQDEQALREMFEATARQLKQWLAQGGPGGRNGNDD